MTLGAPEGAATRPLQGVYPGLAGAHPVLQVELPCALSQQRQSAVRTAMRHACVALRPALHAGSFTTATPQPPKPPQPKRRELLADPVPSVDMSCTAGALIDGRGGLRPHDLYAGAAV